MEVFLNPDAWIALTLTFLEIVLGIDNIIFISIATGKLPVEQRKKSNKNRNVPSYVYENSALFGINLLIQMKEPWFHLSWFFCWNNRTKSHLLSGGLFLIYKSTNEIREK
jgi:predicted tellurium resistance membrane protein TerC